jgi:4-amino-4-deoxy-L-arabinose transferase-like glycosyltransferase
MPTSILQEEEPARAASLPVSPNLLAWIPFLWSRVLFPGAQRPATRICWRSLLWLLIVPGMLLYPCLSFYLFEPDEGRYAEIPREMLARGEWVVPYLQGQPYLDKPPLFYWLVMGSYALLGVHDWTARLVPALAIHGSILVTYLLGRRSVGERAAFWGALALGLAPGFVSMGRLLILDGVLAFCVAVALLSAFEATRTDRLLWGWWLLAALACGLGILAKGPVALLLLLVPLWAQRRLTGGGAPLPWAARLAFLGVLLAVTLPWYVAACLRLPDFARHFFWEHNILRFLSPFDHLRPIWFYGPILLMGLLPGTLLLLPFLRFLFSGDPAQAAKRSRELGYLLLAGGWCLLFFSLSGCKLPTYILPAFPPLALALGVYLAQSGLQHSPWPARLAALSFGLLVVGHYVLVPWYARHHSPMNRAEEVAAYCGEPTTPVVCYPRSVDSVAFYLGRDDFRTYRSKETPVLVRYLQQNARTVILFSHRHSSQQLSEVLPPELQVTGQTQLGLCSMALVQQRRLQASGNR